MRNSFFISILGISLISGMGFTSCCALNELNFIAFAGPNVSSISGESYAASNGMQPGFWAGAAMEMCILGPDISEVSFGQPSNSIYNAYQGNTETKRKRGLFLRPGINYTSQGGKYKEDYGLEGKVILSYIYLPVMARYRTQGGFYAEAGLQPGFLISAKDKYEGNSDDFKKYLKTFELGVPFGLGYEFRNGIGIGVNAIPGITNIDKMKDDPQDAANRNFAVGLKISYTFPSKKKTTK